MNCPVRCAPLLLVCAPAGCATQVRLDGHAPNSSIPVNSEDIAVPFETPLFKGRLLVRVAGLPGDGAADYFRGKKRLMQCAVQVRWRNWEWHATIYTHAFLGQRVASGRTLRSK